MLSRDLAHRQFPELQLTGSNCKDHRRNPGGLEEAACFKRHRICFTEKKKFKGMLLGSTFQIPWQENGWYFLDISIISEHCRLQEQIAITVNIIITFDTKLGSHP